MSLQHPIVQCSTSLAIPNVEIFHKWQIGSIRKGGCCSFSGKGYVSPYCRQTLNATHWMTRRAHASEPNTIETSKSEMKTEGEKLQHLPLRIRPVHHFGNDAACGPALLALQWTRTTCTTIQYTSFIETTSPRGKSIFRQFASLKYIYNIWDPDTDKS